VKTRQQHCKDLEAHAPRLNWTVAEGTLQAESGDFDLVIRTQSFAALDHYVYYATLCIDPSGWGITGSVELTGSSFTTPAAAFDDIRKRLAALLHADPGPMRIGK